MSIRTFKVAVPFNRYYENGKLRAEGNYEYGEPNGSHKWFYEDGNIEGECNYKDGEKDGEKKEYYGNGDIKSVSIYKKGRFINTIKYDQSGKEIPRQKVR